MRKLAVLAIVGAALGGGCGGEPLDFRNPDPEEEAPPRAAQRRGTPPPSAGAEREVPARPTESRAAKRRLIYLDARTLCKEFGIGRVVRTFGLQAGSASEVARSYAKQNYSGPFTETGYRGCLAGFR